MAVVHVHHEHAMVHVKSGQGDSTIMRRHVFFEQNAEPSP